METIVLPGNQTNTFRKFHEFYCNQALCDVSLITHDGATFRAHQLLLAAHSPYFHWLFHGWQQTCQATTDVKLNVQSPLLSVLLSLVYTGQSQIAGSWRHKLLEAATSLQMTHVVEVIQSAQIGTDRCEVGPSATKVAENSPSTFYNRGLQPSQVNIRDSTPHAESAQVKPKTDNSKSGPVSFENQRITSDNQMITNDDKSFYQTSPVGRDHMTQGGALNSPIKQAFHTVDHHYYEGQCPQELCSDNVVNEQGNVSTRTYIPSSVTCNELNTGPISSHMANRGIIMSNRDQRPLVNLQYEVNSGTPSSDGKCPDYQNMSTPQQSQNLYTLTDMQPVSRIKSNPESSQLIQGEFLVNQDENQTSAKLCNIQSTNPKNTTSSVVGEVKSSSKHVNVGVMSTQTLGYDEVKEIIEEEEVNSKSKVKSRREGGKKSMITNVKLSSNAHPSNQSKKRVSVDRLSGTKRYNTRHSASSHLVGTAADKSRINGRTTWNCARDFNSKTKRQNTVKGSKNKPKDIAFTKNKPKDIAFTSNLCGSSVVKRIQTRYRILSRLRYMYEMTGQQRKGRTGDMCRYECVRCCRSFRRYSLWRLHVLESHLGRRKPIPTCPRSRLNSVQPHLGHLDTGRPNHRSRVNSVKPCEGQNVTRPTEDKFKCSECGCVYRLRKTLKHHLLETHGFTHQQIEGNSELLVQCEQSGCQFASISFVEVERHTKSQHPAIRHQCPHCRRPRVFRLQLMLEKHLKKIHGDRVVFSCSECSLQFNKLVHLQEHERDTHGAKHRVKVLRCDVAGCGYETVRQIFLDKHHRTGHQQHWCSHCNTAVKTKETLRTHINTMHLNIRPYLCDVCGMGFAKEAVLRLHVRAKHLQAKEFSCVHCPYATNVHWYLANHMFYRHGVKADFDKRKELSCPRCDVKHLTKSYLEKHIRNVHDEMFKCTCHVCGKTYKSLSALSTHKKVHEEGEHKCTYCDYSSKTGEHMRLHVRTQHIFKGMKPYMCPYCTYCSAIGGNVRKHVTHKHPGQPVLYNTNKEQILYMQVTETQIKTAAHAKGTTP